MTVAQQNGTDNHDQTNGAGLGLVDIFDTNGVFVSHLVATGGQLNAPWGVALADFGTLSNAVLIGNFGDGKINCRISSDWTRLISSEWDHPISG